MTDESGWNPPATVGKSVLNGAEKTSPGGKGKLRKPSDGQLKGGTGRPSKGSGKKKSWGRNHLGDERKFDGGRVGTGTAGVQSFT